jgi:hypothetical protein
MFIVNISESVKRTENHYQIILILDRINVLIIRFEADLYQWVHNVNKTNELCNEYWQAISNNKFKLHNIKLKNCQVIDNALFKKDLLWVFKNMHTKLLQEIHDQSSIFRLNSWRTIDLIQRFYYWSNHRVTIKQYIWNCHVCQQSKTFRNSINELHHSLSILQKYWKDITMNFIIKLFLFESYNVIYIIICRFIKKRHYVLCY